jgi:hypothetical protein
MSASQRFDFRAAAVASLLLFAGCDSGPPVGQVSGKVTFRGQPVTEGRVSFTHVDAGYGADALLEEDGTFSIVTDEGGLLVGDYRVSVTPLVVMDDSDPNTPPVGVEKPAPNIPKKYRDESTSGFTASVTEGRNEVNFDML